MIKKIDLPTVALALLILFLVVAAPAVAQETASPKRSSQSASLPLTTKSKEARRLAEEAMSLWEDQWQQEQAIEIFHTALKLDPDFAMGHQILAWGSLDPAEQVSEQQKAFALRNKVSDGERTLIEWVQDSADHRQINAIIKMNELLQQYPHDKWVVFMATLWLARQTDYERATDVYLNSGINDSPGLINDQAYDYANMREFDKAFAEMDKYVALLPDEANPQDSYGELLRMAGRFEQSIEHYRAALAIDPQFYSSQFGIGDTYSLMGDQVRARREYDLGFEKFSLPELHRIQWQTREATTYVREGDYAGADKAFQAIADYAHSKHMSQVEADSYRQMAIYQPNAKDALTLLDKADAAISEHQNTMETSILQQSALSLRARVETAVRLNDKKLVRSTLKRLSDASQNSDDRLIESAYHGAAGAAFVFEHKYKEAIPQLEDDIHNPLSLKLLMFANEKTHNAAEARRIGDTLNNFNEPTLEQAVVVPAFRKCSQTASCSNEAASLSVK